MLSPGITCVKGENQFTFKNVALLWWLGHILLQGSEVCYAAMAKFDEQQNFRRILPSLEKYKSSKEFFPGFAFCEQRTGVTASNQMG